MNRKNLLGLLLFACLVTAGLFVGVSYLTGLESGVSTKQEHLQDIQNDSTKDTAQQDTAAKAQSGTLGFDAGDEAETETENIETREPWLNTNPTDNGTAAGQTADIAGGETAQDQTAGTAGEGTAQVQTVGTADKEIAQSQAQSMGIDSTFSTSVDTAEAPPLIRNSTEIDYMSYIPDMVMDSQLEAALDISNPKIDVDATAAILFDAGSKKVLYYKNAVQAVFPASTAKLLTALVALDWCNEDEEVTVGEERTMVASDSTTAGIRQGQVLSIGNLLNGLLLPSGNDAAYTIAAYVGRKSLDNASVSKEGAIAEFVRLMNQKAADLGVRNSCFKTPDGYDAIGQYTTAYDMGLIGIAAADNERIVKISGQGKSRNLFPSGEDVTWYNTNRLVRKNYAEYYSNAIGLKTGTSTMAGRCLVAAASKDGRKVISVVMDSSSAGRWEDTLALLKYGLNK